MCYLNFLKIGLLLLVECPYLEGGLGKLPLGVQNIKQILEEGYLYVDKTSFAQRLIEQDPFCIIARPKGFGKTLFLSTLEEILKGNKELFKNTEIYRSNYDWRKYAVFRIDFSQLDSSSSDAFDNDLKVELKKFAESNGVFANESMYLGELIELVYNVSMEKGMDIAVLVDEYDTPIVEHVQNAQNLQALNLAEDHRQTIAFFLKFVTSTIDNMNVKFVFVAGVNRMFFVGGEPIHLKKVEMDPTYATVMGFTEEEVRTTFRNRIRDIAKRRSKQSNVSEEDVLDEMRIWYNGYRFTGKEVSVYNPESTLRYFSAKKVGNYWYSIRNRSLLIDSAARDNMPLGLWDTTVGLRLRLDDFKMERLRYVDVRSLMYHTGYLTIRKYHPERNWYDLDFPNKEARDAYNNTYLLRNRNKDHHGMNI